MHSRILWLALVVLPALLLVFASLPPDLPRGYALEHRPHGVIIKTKDRDRPVVVAGDVQWAAKAHFAICGYTRAHTATDGRYIPEGYFVLTLPDDHCTYSLSKNQMRAILAEREKSP